MPQQAQSILQFHFLFAYEVSEDEGRSTTLASDAVDEYFTWLLAALASLIYEPIGYPEVFLDIFTVHVIDLHVQVLKVFLALHVLLARYVQYVSHSYVYQLFSFEARLVRAHDDARVDFEQVDLP